MTKSISYMLSIGIKKQIQNFKNKILICLLSILGLFATKSSAQTVVLGDSTSISNLLLNECGKADTIETFIRVATGSLSATVVLTDTFLNFYSFEGVVSSPAILSFSGVGTNIARITLDPSILNTGGVAGTRIRYLVRAKCGANGISSAKHSLLLTAGGGFSLYRIGQDFVSANKAATLILEARNSVNQPNAVLGNTYNRHWRYRNTGTNSQIDTTWFRVVYQPGLTHTSLRVDGTLVTPTRINGDTVWYRLIKSLRNQSLFLGDTVFVEERYTVSSCPPSGTNSLISAYWGCYNSSICNATNTTAATQVPLTVPNISYQFLTYAPQNCTPGFDTVTVRLRNTGGKASNIVLDLKTDRDFVGYTYSGMVPTYTTNYLDSGNLWLRRGSGSFIKTGYNQIGFFAGGPHDRTFWPISRPPGIGRIIIDTLANGENIDIRYIYYRPCFDSASAQIYGCQGMEFQSLRATYQNNCGSVNYNLLSTNIIAREGRYGNSTVFGPPSVAQGDTGTYTFLSGWGNNYTQNVDTSGRINMRIMIPKGLVWDGNAANLIQTHLSGSPVVNPVSYSYNTSANVLTVSYPMVNGGFSSMRTRIKFYVDCSIPGAGGGNIETQWFIKEKAVCNSCNLALGCYSRFFVNPICPSPCPRGGVVAYRSRLTRLTLGVPDNNQDGIPDGSGSLNMSEIELDKMAYNDTFSIVQSTRILRGAWSPASFTHGYAQITIPYNVQFVSATARLTDASSGISYTISNIGSSLAVSGSNRIFTLDYSPNSASGYPGGYVFDNNDTIILDMRFRCIQQFSDPFPWPTTVRQVPISIYVSDRANPSASDTFRYVCTGIDNYFRTFGHAMFLHNRDAVTHNGCGSFAINYRFYAGIGGYGGNAHYPYEFRGFSYLDSVRIDIPQGVTVDSFVINYQRQTNYVGTTSIPSRRIFPVAISGNTWVFTPRTFFSNFGGPFPISSVGWAGNLAGIYRPTCATVSNTVLPVGNAQAWFKGVNSWTGPNLAPQVNSVGGENAAQFLYRAPVIDLQNFGAISADGIGRTVSWDVRIQNGSAFSSAENTWLAFRSNSGLIIVDSVRDLSSNALLPQTSGIYRAGSIASAGASKTYRIFAKYNSCNFDSLWVLSSWNCSPPGYPTSINNRPCPGDSVKVYLRPLEPLVQSDLISTPTNPVNLCDTLQWIVSISSRQLGAAFGTTLDVQIPDGGAGGAVVPTYEYKYPFNVASWTRIIPVNLGGGIFRFYLADSILAIRNNGLRPIGEAPFNELLLKVRMVTNCNFTSGSNVRFITRSNKACGQAITPDAEFNPISINGAPAPKLQLLAEITPGISTCDSQYIVSTRVLNFEGTPSGTNDFIWITLPDGARFVTGSTVFSRNPLSPLQPVIDTLAGRQRLKWTANSIPAIDSTIFTFRYFSPSNIPCGTNNEFKLQTVTQFSAVCGLTTCQSFVENSRKELNRPVMKPNLRYMTGTGSARIVQDTTVGNVYFGDTIALQNIQFINQGTDTADKPIATVFADLNGNNQLDLSDRILFVDTFPLILPGNTFTYSETRVAPHRSLPASSSIKMLINQSCNCDNARFVATPLSTFIPLNAIEFSIVAEKSKTEKASIVSWQYVGQNQPVQFLVQRRLANSQNFETIATVQNTNHGGIYSYQDRQSEILTGVVTYRIISVAQSGIQEKSAMRVVVFTSNVNYKNGFVLWPNPAKNNLNILSETDERMEIFFYNANGKNLLSQTYSGGLASILLNDISTGLYFVKVSQNGQIETFKVFVE